MKTLRVSAALLVMSMAACSPSVNGVKDDLRSVQEDLKAIAERESKTDKAINFVCDIASFAEKACGYGEFVPLTDALSKALQETNRLVAAKEAEERSKEESAKDKESDYVKGR